MKKKQKHILSIAVAGFVDAGLGFTIDTKVTVNGLSQYKVHNSKGKTYYITTSKAYVYVVK